VLEVLEELFFSADAGFDSGVVEAGASFFAAVVDGDEVPLRESVR
jgi:hypothetical protein